MRDARLKEYGRDILQNETYGTLENYIQHGRVTVLEHSLRVAETSLRISDFCRKRFRWSCREREMVRGALLHDYFLYDWHEKGKGHGLHGFTHAAAALNNARKDYVLTHCEEEIIHKHMFPLNVTRVPMCREAWIVTMADKYCSLIETIAMRK